MLDCVSEAVGIQLHHKEEANLGNVDEGGATAWSDACPFEKEPGLWRRKLPEPPGQKRFDGVAFADQLLFEIGRS